MTNDATEKIPLQVTFKDIAPSPAIEARVRREADKLVRFHPRLMDCHVTIAAPHRHHHKGKVYTVRIRLTVPAGNLWINRSPSLDHAHEDVHVAIRDAFNAATRRLEDRVRLRSGRVKHHDMPSHGTVTRLFADEGYGFIQAGEGREVYFHANAVVDGAFKRLEVGSQVRFVAAEGESDKGPQATTVKLIGKHQLAEP